MFKNFYKVFSYCSIVLKEMGFCLGYVRDISFVILVLLFLIVFNKCTGEGKGYFLKYN